MTTTRSRSPNYPRIDLRGAVGLLEQLYPKVQRGEFSPEDAARAWGYSGSSSSVGRVTGALRQYGLLEAKKGDNARLTPIALMLVLREPESQEYRSALRQAIESPALFKELIASGRADNATGALRQYLVMEKDFTREGADTFIKVFRASIAFAEIDQNYNIALPDEDLPDGSDEAVPTAMPAADTRPSVAVPSAPLPPPGAMAIPIPLSNGEMGTVTLPVGMTVTDWKRLYAILGAYEPSLKEPIQSSAFAASERIDDEPDTE